MTLFDKEGRREEKKRRRRGEEEEKKRRRRRGRRGGEEEKIRASYAMRSCPPQILKMKMLNKC